MNRILILSDINSAHSQKWCTALAQAGFSMGIFTLSFPTNNWYESFENISVFCPIRFTDDTFHSGAIAKLKYLKAIPALKKVIREFAPDIVHAHYATSYGLIGALADFHPYFISAWGSDLMDFPYKNLINSRLIKYILKKADRVFATSKTLALHVAKFTTRKIDIIPFGVDTTKFKPVKMENIFKTDCLVIGTAKSMEQIYGIDILINAFAQLNLKYPQMNLRLLLVGSGSREMEYKQLAKNLKIQEQTFFAGRIPHNELPKYYNMMDIFVNVSHNESFGVSVLEASACEKPVIVTKTGGLIEVIEENITGLFVVPGNIDCLYDSLKTLIHDTELRSKMGTEGRKFVAKNYDWSNSVEKMENVYRTF